MIQNDIIGQVLEKCISGGAEFSDIFSETREAHSIMLEDRKIERVNSGFDSGVGIRSVLKGRSSYGYSNDFSPEILLGLADAISYFPSDADFSIPSLIITKPQIEFFFGKKPSDIPVGKKASLLFRADQTARNYDPRIKQVSIYYRELVQHTKIANSIGNVSEETRIYTLFAINVVAIQNGLIQTGYEAAGGLVGFELFGSISPEDLAFRASQRAVTMLQARHAPAGRMPVVISAEAGGTMIHEAIGHGLEADLAQQGLSVYSRKLGHRIASDLVTIIDDSTLPNKRGSFLFDDEGTPSQKTILVENGILKNYLYDKLTAARDGTESTGNGRRESYKSRPIPRMTNTFLAPGTTVPSDIIGSVEEGLFVKKMGGGQVNTISGDFVFDVQEGYLIKKGKITEPVRGATLSGNGPGILLSIDMVGNDLGFSIGTCGKDSQGIPVTDAMPTVRIPEIVIGGKI